jgi:hypothetical protein
MTHDIDDAYGTCKDTYVTLRIFSDTLSPREISDLLKVEPTSSHKKGDVKTNHPLATKPNHETNGWFYSTKGRSSSRDCRRHLNMLIDGVIRCHEALAQLRQIGCDMDVTIFYSYTQGGPTISPAQMSALATADLDVWWDLYRASEREDLTEGASDA